MNLHKNHLIQRSSPRYEPCYWGTMFQPAVIFQIGCSNELLLADTVERIQGLRQLLFTKPLPDNLIVGDGTDFSVAHLVSLMALDVLSSSKMPIKSGARLVSLKKKDSYLLGLPTLGRSVKIPQDALDFSIRLIHSVIEGKSEDLEYLSKQLNKAISINKASAPAGINSLRFLDASHELKVPWRHVVDNIYQFGWGVNARLLNSSFTDKTSVIGSQLARHKYSCARALSMVGIPTPQHIYLKSERDVLNAYQSLGFPLVIKPENLDGGRGVVVGIDNLQDLIAAYKNAVQLSSKILLEKYVAGHDYRLQVFGKEVYWVAHRRPARVIGDGTRTVAQLIEQINRQREQRSGEHLDDEMMVEFGSEPIVVDDQVHIWLNKQALGLDSIPIKGQEVRLKGAANFSQGGTREGIPLSRVHPDNIDLAVKAVRTLRLDLAGVDLLIPDISQSYKAVGGVICEVNAQPQLSKHLPSQILSKLVPGGGRIPTVMLLGIDMPESVRNRIHELALKYDCLLGWADTVMDCLKLLCDPDVGVLVWQNIQVPNRYDPCPIDEIDLLISTREVISQSRARSESKTHLWPSIIDRAKKILYSDQVDVQLETILTNLFEPKNIT